MFIHGKDRFLLGRSKMFMEQLRKNSIPTIVTEGDSDLAGVMWDDSGWGHVEQVCYGSFLHFSINSLNSPPEFQFYLGSESLTNTKSIDCLLID